MHAVQHLAAQAFELGQIGPLQRERDALAAAHVGDADVGDRDAGDARQPFAHRRDQVGHAALAVLAVLQAHIDRSVDLALGKAAVDGGDGVAHLGQFAQRGVDLLGTHLGDFQR